jgi:hypothetical protein
MVRKCGQVISMRSIMRSRARYGAPAPRTEWERTFILARAPPWPARVTHEGTVRRPLNLSSKQNQKATEQEKSLID